jgi:regulator of cell morphogenesis and NO signaling
VINLATTLGELVTRHEQAAQILERAGLDYCCGGHRTLRAAAEEAGLDGSALLGEILREVPPADPAPEWSTLDPAALCDHLTVTHHAYLRERLPELVRLSEKVVGVHGERHPELVDIDQALQVAAAELIPHLEREEHDLFPAVRARRAIPAELMDALDDDHHVVGALLDTIRNLSHQHGPPDDACASYQLLYRQLAELDHDLRLHVHKENNVLFPALVASTTPREPAGG